MSAPVIASTRRISAGITPDPGATAGLPSWWGEEDWLSELAAALDERPELLRDHHVSRDAVVKLAERMAAFADFRTGRNARPTNERLVELCQCSLSTVQRARRVLKGLGLVVEVLAGRSLLTRTERLEAWRRGSSHRRIAAVFALCSRRSRRAPKVSSPKVRGVDNSLGASHLVEGDTPPGAKGVSYSSHLRTTHLRRRTENEERRSAPRTDRRGLEPGVRRLAERVRGRLGWLGGVSVRRIAPPLARLARAGWTERDVDLAVADALAVRGWRVPRELQHPAAYLAGLLRGVDPADRPTVWADAYEAVQRAEDAYRLQLVTGTPCGHGMPAGNVPSPLRGLMACPLCRQEQQ